MSKLTLQLTVELLERPKDSGSDRIFVVLQGPRRGQPMTRAALRRIFRTRREQKALTNANPHRLRHTFGTDMARSGVRLPILQRMMGHAYAKTTLQYINVSLADVGQVIDITGVGTPNMTYTQRPWTTNTPARAP